MGRRRTTLSFLSRCHMSIISSSSRLGRGVFLPLHGPAGPQIIVFYGCREHVLGVIDFLSSLGRMWGSCCCSVAQSCPTFCKPWTVARQPPFSMGFSRQRYWSGLPFPPLGDLLDPEIEPCPLCLLHWQAGFFFFYHQHHVGRGVLLVLESDKPRFKSKVSFLLALWICTDNLLKPQCPQQ